MKTSAGVFHETSILPRLNYQSVRIAICIFLAQVGVALIAYASIRATPTAAVAFWLPAGVSTGLIVAFGRRFWPVIYLANVIASVFFGPSLLAELIVSSAAPTSALIASYLLDRFAGPTFRIAQFRHFCLFILTAAMISPVTSAFIGLFGLFFAGQISFAAACDMYFRWWLGDGVAIAIVGAPIITFTQVGLSWERSVQAWRRFNRLDVLLLAFFVASFFIAFPTLCFSARLQQTWFGHGDYPYLIFPAVTLLAIRFGVTWAAISSLIMAAFAMVVMVTDLLRPFWFTGSVNALQALIAVISVTGYSVAALTGEKRKAVEDKEEFSDIASSTLETLSEGILIYDATGKLCKANQAMADLVGVPVSQLVGGMIGKVKWALFREDGESVSQDERPGVICFRTGEPVETRVYRGVSQKREVWVEISAAPIKNKSGSLVGVVVRADDIGDKIADKKRSAVYQSEFKRIADLLPVFIYKTDQRGGNTYKNAAWEAFSGPDKTGSVATHWSNLIDPEHRHGVITRQDAALARREAYQEKFRLRRPDGVYAWFADMGAPQFDEKGLFLGYVGCLVEIDESQILLEKTAAMAEVGLAWRAGRGALVDIERMVASLIERMRPGIRIDDNIRDAVMDDLRMIDDILGGLRSLEERLSVDDFMKEPAAEDAPPGSWTHHIRSVIDGAIKTVRSLVKESVWPIIVKINDNAGESLVPATMQSVVVNLIMNAKEAMADGGPISIDVRVLENSEVGWLASGSSGWLRIAVGDHGSGISLEDISLITKPFWGRKRGASGLGLTVVERVVKEAGGRLDIDSTPGRGTTVQAFLPLHAGGAVEDAVPIGHGERIVLTLADQSNAQMMSAQLQSLGYLPHLMSSAAEIPQEPVRLAICEPFRISDAQKAVLVANRIPIIWISTAKKEDLLEHQLIETDAFYMRMPYSLSEFAHFIRDALARNLAAVWTS